MSNVWLHNFICKDLYAPFVIEKDIDYYDNLKEKYKTVLTQAKNAGADPTAIKIIEKYKNRILKSLDKYYKADLIGCYNIVKKLIKEIGENPYAVNDLANSDAFLGEKHKELQFFRARLGDFSAKYSSSDMLPMSRKDRAKSGNYRFSIPGNPSWYLSNSSYGCWIETGFPSPTIFNVAPVTIDKKLRIFNLAVSVRDLRVLGNLEEENIHCWLKLFMLTIATSYRVVEDGRIFRSEYVISQAIMMACKSLGYDGVAYFSKRVSDVVFSYCAINLALFVDYDNDDPVISKYISIDDAFNFFYYKQLGESQKNKQYELRSLYTGVITNIGEYEHQFSYGDTEFAKFDRFLFCEWQERKKRKQNYH